MDDPELHSGERILIRTAGVHVKSISFEAILTNKRIILSDRSKNILPQKEIPLALIKTVDAGENAIRELVITLEVVSNSDRMRQMVLTFSRERGGNRAKERNEWVRLIKENLITSFKQDSTVIPGIDPKETAGAVSPPKFKIVGSPLSQTPAAHYKQAIKPQPVKKNVASPPVTPWQVPSAPEAAPAPVPTISPSVTFGTYCTRCGTKVPDGSGFCNKCGAKIIVPGEVPQVLVTIPVPAASVQTVEKEQPTNHEIEIPSVILSRDSQEVVPPKPAIELEIQPEVTPAAARPQKRFMSRLFSPKDLSPPPHVPTSVPLAKPRRRKKLVIALGIVIVIIIAVVAVAVVLPKAGFVESILSGFNSSGPSTTIANSTGTIAMTPTTETIVPITQVTAATTIPVIINQAASIMTSVTEKITTPTPAIINQAVSIMT